MQHQNSGAVFGAGCLADRSEMFNANSPKVLAAARSLPLNHRSQPIVAVAPSGGPLLAPMYDARFAGARNLMNLVDTIATNSNRGNRGLEVCHVHELAARRQGRSTDTGATRQPRVSALST